jgi:tetratricopeptide (TPR) repeat protein
MGTDRRAAAGDVCEKAAALLFPLVQKEPDSSEYSLALAAAYVNWSHFLRGDRRPQDALRALDRAVELTEAALRREPNLGTARVRGYNAHGARAQLHQSQRHWAEAVKDWDRVVELDGQPQPWIRRALRAVVLARAGEHARAAAEVTALEGKPEVTAEGILELARASALSVEPARSDARLSSGERDELAERYAARAVALLRRLKEQGWFKSLADLLNLATDPDFKSLRGRDDFKKLLAPAGGDRPE